MSAAYVELLSQTLKREGMTVAELARRSQININRLRKALRGEAILTREQAFYVGLALNLSPVNMERLALLVVLAHAERPEFRQHILQKLTKVNALESGGSWQEYIQSAMHRPGDLVKK